MVGDDAPSSSSLTSLSVSRSLQHTANLAVSFMGLAVFFGVLYFLQPVLIPFVIAFFLAYLVRPLAKWIAMPLELLAAVPCCARCCRCFSRRRIAKQLHTDGISGYGVGAQEGGSSPRSRWDNVEAEESELEPCFGPRKRRRSPADGGESGGVSSPSAGVGDDSKQAGAGDEGPLGDVAESEGEGKDADGARAPTAATSSPKAAATATLDDDPEHMWPHWVGVTLAALIVLGFIALLIVIVVDAVQEFEAEHFRKFKERAVVLTERFVEHFRKLFHIRGDSLVKFVKDAEGTMPVEFLKGMVMTAWGWIADFLAVFLFLIYLLLERQQHSSSVRNVIDTDVQTFIVTKAALSAILGFCVFLVLIIIGVKMPHLFGVLTFLLNFIPTVGALIAMLLTLPVILLDPELSTASMVLAILFPLLLHAIIGDFIEPLLIQRLIVIHPIVVLLAVTFWYLLWGIAGALVSVPITVSLRQWLIRGVDHPYAPYLHQLLEGNVSWMWGSRTVVHKSA